MKIFKKIWKKPVTKILAAILIFLSIVLIGFFLWTKTWKTFTFKDTSLTFKYPSGGTMTYNGPEGFSEYRIDYKNLFYLAISHFNCTRSIKTPNLDKETCGEKSVSESIDINAKDTHPFLTTIPKETLDFSGHKGEILTLKTRKEIDSNDTSTNTTFAFNDKDEVYFFDFGNYFSDKNIFLRYSSTIILKIIINSIKFN